MGVVASLIGSALLGWGVFPISMQNQTFTDMFNACAASPALSCTALKTLILLGVRPRYHVLTEIPLSAGKLLRRDPLRERVVGIKEQLDHP